MLREQKSILDCDTLRTEPYFATGTAIRLNMADPDHIAGLAPDSSEKPAGTALEDAPPPDNLIMTSNNWTPETAPSVVKGEAAVEQTSDVDQAVYPVSSNENQSANANKRSPLDSIEEIHSDLSKTGKKSLGSGAESDASNSIRRRPTTRRSQSGRSNSPSEVERQQDDEEKSTIVQQIRALQEQLYKLEQKATATSRAQAVRDEWERDMGRYGPVGELNRWKDRRKQIHAKLLRDSTKYAEGKQWMNSVAEEADQRMMDDVKYSKRLLKLREKWEQQHKLDNSFVRKRRGSGISDSVGTREQAPDRV
jgi:hypothetical protein